MVAVYSFKFVGNYDNRRILFGQLAEYVVIDVFCTGEDILMAFPINNARFVTKAARCGGERLIGQPEFLLVSRSLNLHTQMSQVPKA